MATTLISRAVFRSRDKVASVDKDAYDAILVAEREDVVSAFRPGISLYFYGMIRILGSIRLVHLEASYRHRLTGRG